MPFSTNVFAPFLGAIGGLASNILSTKYSHASAQRAEDKAWARETAYNHPLAQRSRLEQAGLNPALMYTAGTTSVGGNTHASIAQRSPYSLENALSRYSILDNQLEQNRVVRLTGKNIEAQTEEVKARTRQINHETRIAESSGMSVRDPFYARIGGRAADIFSSVPSYLSPSDSGYKPPLHYNYNKK